jgi:hypothetical protein
VNIEILYNMVLKYSQALKKYESAIDTARRLKNAGVLTQEEYNAVAEFIKNTK